MSRARPTDAEIAAALAEMRKLAARRAARATDESRDYRALRALWRRWRGKIRTADIAEASGVQEVTVRKQWQ